MQKALIVLKWLWEFIKLPLNLAEHLKLLKEVKETLISPSRYNEELEWAKNMFDMKIQNLIEEKEKIAVSDSEKRAMIEFLISKFQQARENSAALIEQNKKLIEERDVFREAFKSSERMIKSLNEGLEKYKLGEFPLYSKDALQNAFEQALSGKPLILGRTQNVNPFSTFLKTDKK